MAWRGAVSRTQHWQAAVLHRSEMPKSHTVGKKGRQQTTIKLEDDGRPMSLGAAKRSGKGSPIPPPLERTYVNFNSCAFYMSLPTDVFNKVMALIKLGVEVPLVIKADSLSAIYSTRNEMGRTTVALRLSPEFFAQNNGLFQGVDVKTGQLRILAHAAPLAAQIKLIKPWVEIFRTLPTENKATGVFEYDDSAQLNSIVVRGPTSTNYTRVGTDDKQQDQVPQTTPEQMQVSFVVDTEKFGEILQGQRMPKDKQRARDAIVCMTITQNTVTFKSHSTEIKSERTLCLPVNREAHEADDRANHRCISRKYDVLLSIDANRMPASGTIVKYFSLRYIGQAIEALKSLTHTITIQTGEDMLIKTTGEIINKSKDPSAPDAKSTGKVILWTNDIKNEPIPE